MFHARLRRTSAVAALAMGLALGGCQIFGGGGIAHSTSPRADLAAGANFGAEQLAGGRVALQEGRTIEAIEAFMLAKTDQRIAPAAYNGLAVAYSRLGRTDLTERFFLTAVALAPSEDRFRANLARFYTQHGMQPTSGPAPALALSQPMSSPEAAPAAPAVAAAVPTARVLKGGITVMSPDRDRLQRAPSGEVSVRTGDARPMQSTRRAVLEVGGQTAPTYPVRIVLGKHSAPPSYPIRIELPE